MFPSGTFSENGYVRVPRPIPSVDNVRPFGVLVLLNVENVPYSPNLLVNYNIDNKDLNPNPRGRKVKSIDLSILNIGGRRGKFINLQILINWLNSYYNN